MLFGMCGCVGAMCGCCYGERLWAWRFLILSRFCMAFLGSLALHAFVLMLPVHSWSNASFAGRVDGRRDLQVSLLPKESSPVRLQSHSTQRAVGLRSNKEAGKKRGVPVTPVFIEARLASEISLHIDDPAAFGFMILCVELDPVGAVLTVSVLYSDFSPEAAASVVHEFATARFEPAQLDGEKQGATLLFRVDVD